MSEAKVDAAYQARIDWYERLLESTNEVLVKVKSEREAARARLDASEALCERYRKALEEIVNDDKPGDEFAQAADAYHFRKIARAALSAPCDSPGDNAAGS